MPRDSSTSLCDENRSAEKFRQQFLREVSEGLSRNPKSLPCKYFYDETGSRLFDRICGLQEYYLTRTETRILSGFAGEIAAAVGDDAVLIELGSGSSTKTRLVLDAADQLAAYVPVDISEEYLSGVADSLRSDYPHLEVQPVAADFTRPFTLPTLIEQRSRRVLFFPGSTIGNFTPRQSRSLLENFRTLCGDDGGLLLGIDLQKDTGIIEAAYNDSLGVTAAFNRNILSHINRELDGTFDEERFEHRARYEPEHARVRISLVSCCEQTALVEGRRFHFETGEEILTEYSHKFDLGEFQHRVAQAGFDVQNVWTDAQNWFAVIFCHARQG